MMRRKNLLILVSLLLALAAAGAYAAFSSAGTGSATASTGTLNAATTAVAQASNNSTANGPSPVTITWNAPSGGLAPTGYKVLRSNGTTQSDASCGVVTTTTCTDTSVPDGTYTYVVRSLYNNSWTADSAASNSLQVVNDEGPPAVTLTFPTNGSSYNIDSYGGTCFPIGVCGSATDAAGVHGVQVSIKRNSDGSYWNGSSFVSSLLELFNSANLLSPDDTSTDWDYAFTRPADGGYTVNVRATDTAGNAPGSGSYSASATFTVDTAAPAVTLTAPANNSATTNTKPTFSGAAANATGDQPAIAVRIYSGSTTGGALVQTLNTTASAGAWSMAPATALADGTYTGQASQSDTAGNTGSSAANTFTIDTTAPSGGYTFPAAGATYNTTGWNSACATAGFCGTATDAGSGVATVQLQIKQISTNNNWDGSTFRAGNRMVNATVGAGAWSYAFNASSFPAGGQYQVSGTITDTVGTTFTLAARTFTIDTAAPTVTLTAPANGARTSSTKPTFAGAAGTASGDLAPITVQIYSGSTAGGTLVQTLSTTASAGAWSVAPTTALAEGTYTAQASQSDSAGNTGTSPSTTFAVDITAPAVTVTAPAAGSTTASQTPAISGAAGTATGDLTAITVKIYNGTGTGGSVAQTLSATASAGTWSATPAGNLAAGTYTVQASQSDSVGNTGTSSAVSFAINITAPTIDSKPAVKSANANPSFGFSHGIYTKFQCKLDAAAVAACNTGSVSYSAIATGSHTFTLTALDAQNTATQAATYTWTIDTAAPTIGSKPANPSATASPTFSFSHANYTNMQCSLDAAAFSACTSATGQNYTGLSEGSHTFQIKALDGDGVSTQTASYAWTQRTTAPTITAKPSDPSANKTPSFSFSESGYSNFQCSVNGGSYTACTSGSAITTLADGSRSFAVRAVDGNLATTASTSYTWTINSAAPGITSASGMTASSTYASTTAAFNFSHGAYINFQCYLDSPANFVACANGKLFSGLADGSHAVTASALDSDNVTTSNGTFTWTVKHVAPTVTAQPTSPTNSTTTTFNFNETPYTLFQCQLDGGGFAACNAGTQTYSGLSGGPTATGVSHTFLVHAVDSLNASTADQTVTWTVDTVAPTGVTATSCAASGPANNRQLGSSSGGAGNASTDSTTVSLKIYSGTGTGTLFQSGLSATRSGATWTYAAGSSKLTAGSTYTLQATQSDAAGNTTVGTTVCTFTA